MIEQKNLNKLSKPELADLLDQTLARLAESTEKNHLQRITHDLHTHQIELEMQNRELLETQEKLEASRNRYLDLYDFAPIGYLTLDDQGVIRDINLTGSAMLGKERSNIIGMPFSLFLRRTDAGRFFNHIRKAFTSTDNVLDELNLMQGKESSIVIQIESRSFGIFPETERQCRSIITDINERKLADNALRLAKQQAEEANKVKAEFLARMTHELRTPLNAIIGFAQALDMADDIPDTVEHHHYANMITQSGWHLLRIINDVLNLSALEANKVDIYLENIKLGTCISHCIETLTPLAMRQNVTINVHEVPHDTNWVHADDFRLKQILLNLLANAIKYNRENGMITVTCCSRDNDFVRIAISDTGKGIPEESITSLFQPFSQVHDRPYTIQGAGIGLSIAKQLTELMQGRIGVDSVCDQGSTFWIELPKIKRMEKLE